ncbi:MAG: ABC transporter permease [Eubacterium sp.]|nr:ABC transporter permease [Eubacterium sp.]
MQVFKLFLKVTRSKIGIGILYTVIFFAICFPMVNASEEKIDFEDTSLNLYIRDEDQSEASKALVDLLAEKHHITDRELDQQGLMDAMYYSLIDYSLVIPKGYSELLASSDKEDLKKELFEEFHLRDSYATAMMNVFLQEYVRNTRMSVAMGDDLMTAVKKSAEREQVDIEVVQDPEEELYDENFTPKYAWFFRLLMYILIAVIMSMLGPILITMNGEEQKKRIQCSKTTVSSYVTQVFIGSAVLVLAVWLIFLVGGAAMYGGMYTGQNSWLAVLNSFIFALFVAMFTIFISTFRPSSTVMSMIAQVVGLGMAFLCGGFISQSMLGEGMLKIMQILPGYWYERANDMLCGDQKGTLGDIWICFAVQGGFILLFLILTIIKSSIHKSQPKTAKTQAKTA